MKDLLNGFRTSMTAGDPVFGIWLAIPSQLSAELGAVVEPDYVCIDQQHGQVGYESMVAMLQAIGRQGPLALTRVPSNDPTTIALSLDAGACGIVVPMVNTREDAEKLVAAVRYPPEGVRSYGPIRAARILQTRDPKELGSLPLCIAMVETPDAIENVHEIATTPGIDALYVGPSDLAVGLGLPPGLDQSAPEHVAAMEHVVRACKSAGVGAGVQCSSGTSAKRFAEMGYTMLTVAKDSVALEASFRQHLADARNKPTEHEVAYL